MANKSAGSFGNNIPPKLVNAVLVVFVLGWVGSLAAEIFKAGYSAPTGLNETMIALVTAFFVAQQRLSSKDDKDDDKGDGEQQQQPQSDSPTPTEDAT